MGSRKNPVGFLTKSLNLASFLVEAFSLCLYYKLFDTVVAVNLQSRGTHVVRHHFVAGIHFDIFLNLFLL
jgi:hypothetical protein